MICSNPQPFINPTALRFWRGASKVVINGREYSDLHPYSNYINTLSCVKTICKYDPVQNHYNCDAATFDSFSALNYLVFDSASIPLYVQRPCRVCTSCRDARRLEYERRLLFEASDSACCAFFTYTYDDAHLPFCGLRKSDVSSALKRLRIRIERYCKVHNLDSEFFKFRAVYCGEYGVDPKYSRRAHYHGLLFFKKYIPYNYRVHLLSIFYDKKEARTIYTKTGKERVLPKVWPHGYRRSFEFCRNLIASSKYISKYITKQDFIHVPPGKTPSFIQGTSRNGGIGCSNLDAHLDNILRSDGFSVCINIGGSVRRVGIPRNMLEKIFPPLSRQCLNANLVYQCLTLCDAYLSDDPLYNGDFHSVIDGYSFVSLGCCLGKKSKFLLKVFKNCLNDYGHTYAYESALKLSEYLVNNCPDYLTFKHSVFKKLDYFQRRVTSASVSERVVISENRAFNNLNYVRNKMVCDIESYINHYYDTQI